LPRIAIIPGDGIGVDVTAEAVKVMQTVDELWGLGLELVEHDLGAERFLRTGETLPQQTLNDFRENYEAIFLGALGDPRIPDMRHAKDILLGLRFKLDLYVNYRPIKLLFRDLCPLKGKGEKDVDFVIFRENTEGLYVGMGGIFKEGTPDEIAVQEDVNTRKGVERILRHAFEFAKERGLGRVTMSDKSNVLRFGHDLWLRVFEEVGAEYPDIESQHLYVDVLTMQMVKLPEQFDVIVTCNMFGDIVTDLGAQIQGGMGLAASGNIHPGRISMFEPVHGSAPKYAGKDIANPLAAIQTVQLMLDHLGHRMEALGVEEAVRKTIVTGQTTRDLGGNLGTRAVGDHVCKILTEMEIG
jgi:3-isopropylmalate dehydrogenase